MPGTDPQSNPCYGPDTAAVRRNRCSLGRGILRPIHPAELSCNSRHATPDDNYHSPCVVCNRAFICLFTSLMLASFRATEAEAAQRGQQRHRDMLRRSGSPRRLQRGAVSLAGNSRAAAAQSGRRGPPPGARAALAIRRSGRIRYLHPFACLTLVRGTDKFGAAGRHKGGRTEGTWADSWLLAPTPPTQSHPSPISTASWFVKLVITEQASPKGTGGWKFVQESKRQRRRRTASRRDMGC